MANEFTFCAGHLCNEREDCLRFIKGKGTRFGWWFEGKNSPYEKCEMKIKTEEKLK